MKQLLRYVFAAPALLLGLNTSCTEKNTVLGSWSLNDDSDSVPLPGPPPMGGTTGGGSGGSGGDPTPSPTPQGGGTGGDTSPLLGLTFEAEDGSLSGALSVGSDDVDGVSFIEATTASPTVPGTGLASYRFEITEAGNYKIWARIHSPGPAENRFWFRVDGGPWALWRISTGDEWYWDDLHLDRGYHSPEEFDFSPGEHVLEFSNAVLGAELNRITIQLATEPAPGEASQCSPPNSVLLNGECVSSCGSYGNVSCEPAACEGRPELVSYDCAICCLL